MFRPWQSLKKTERDRLLIYAQYCKLNNPTETETEEMLALCLWCVEFNLCVSEIPDEFLSE